LTRTRSAGDLYWIITNGVPGTDMPAYDLALTENERWDLVAYLRQLPSGPNPDEENQPTEEQ
jgi:mono/diheme cytochrome c family protein